jgi:putative intracellular protease/amidase
MKPIVVLLRDGWADWEAGYLLGAAGYFVGVPARIATPNAAPVRSTGGLRASADAAFRDLVPADHSAIALIGGPGWSEPDAAVLELLAAAAKVGIPIGGICAATIPLARAGLLDSRSHTSNGVGYLEGHVPEYLGARQYLDSAAAVADQGVVTAPGTAPSTFAVGLLRMAAPGSAAVLDQLLTQSAREHRPGAERSGH